MSSIVAKPKEAEDKTDKRELTRNIDATYYGFRDEEDGTLVPVELKLEAEGNVNGIT